MMESILKTINSAKSANNRLASSCQHLHGLPFSTTLRISVESTA